MRKKGLVYKTVLVYTLISAVCVTSICVLLSLRIEKHYFDQKRIQMNNQGKVLSERAIKHINFDDEVPRDRIKEDMALLASNVDADIFLINKTGFVLIVSDDKYSYLEFKNFMEKELTELRQGKTIETTGRYQNLFNEEMYIYMIPIFENEEFLGAIATFTPIAQIYEPIKRENVFMWSIALGMIGVAAVCIYALTKKMIIHPLAEINRAAQKISKGEVERRVQFKSNDEIGDLAESFNTMADSLEKVEKNRRDFISNVSHELRTPITSIKGFIGGILDGVIPKDKENYYLTITYEEIQRLTRLVNDLLDLSVLDSGKFKLNISELDINEIIRLCVIKSEAKINSKQLNVDVTLQDEHLYVLGDRDRVIQVVTNLLDNAVKYVNDGGNIKIVTRTKSDKVLVSLYNDGPKISEEDIRHIWERFYKSDKSRTSKVSTGLGLPIVRNILTQLGEDIWVENGEKEGVTFYFTLKKV
ncbi:sensor histidine kinase [Clostridium thermarum]|uniref:sensor histidine kinase n=1 Tax=Clostridium thermarum TaxID=1716543 RepID=UPI001122C9B4|nr:ATP-binding protein [Clostridium thermarum]